MFKLKCSEILNHFCTVDCCTPKLGVTIPLTLLTHNTHLTSHGHSREQATQKTQAFQTDQLSLGPLTWKQAFRHSSEAVSSVVHR